MSRIGKAPVEIPDKVKVTVAGQLVSVEGPKGKLEVELQPQIQAVVEDNKVIVKKVSEERKAGALWGLSRTLINNAVIGVSKGFEKKLEIVGVGYRANVQGKTLNLALGYSHPVTVEAPEGIEIKVENNTQVTVSGYNKQTVGDVAAEIRGKRPPEVYKGKGIKYEGEYIRRKAGKAGKK